MRVCVSPASYFPPLASFVFCLSCVSSAWAGLVDLGPAQDFNLFVFNNNTQSGSDAQGKVAVGNNATLGSFTIASSMGNNTTNFIVGGNLSNSGTQFHGGLLVNGDLNWATPTIGGSVSVNHNATFTGGGSVVGPVHVVNTYTAPNYFPPNTSNVPTPLPFNFSSVHAFLNSQSANLAIQPATGSTIIQFSQVHLTANNLMAPFVIFSVNGADLAAAAGHGMSITAAPGSTVVVNVNGTTDSMQNMSIVLNGVDKQHVLYNFYQATSLTLSGIGVPGTILAPLADVHFSGNIDGTLIANNLDGAGESHWYPFLGVPEPSTIVLAGCGAVALAACGARSRRRRA